MITPRPYLSWSSMNLFENNVEAWKDLYLYGKKMRTNRGMAFGRDMADSLECGKATGDAVLDLVISQIPKFEIMDKVIQTEDGIEVEADGYDGTRKVYRLPFIKNGKNPIPILAKPDSMRPDMMAFKEYKTGQAPWTKKQVDENGQITFYATAIFIIKRRIPHDIELVHVQTAKEGSENAVDAKIAATGAINRHPTMRNMSQVLNMMCRMKKAWIGMQEVTAREML